MTHDTAFVTQQLARASEARATLTRVESEVVEKLDTHLNEANPVSLRVTQQDRAVSRVELDGVVEDGDTSFPIHVDATSYVGCLESLSVVTDDSCLLFSWEEDKPAFVDVGLGCRDLAYRYAAFIVSAVKSTCDSLFGFDDALLATARLMAEGDDA